MQKENRRDFLKRIRFSSILGVGCVSQAISQETNNKQEIIDSPIKPGIYYKDDAVIRVTDEIVHVSTKEMNYWAYEEGVELLSSGKGVEIIFKDLLHYSNTGGLQGRVDGTVDEIEMICKTSSESIKLKRQKKEPFDYEISYMGSRGAFRNESVGDNHVGWFMVGGNLLRETREKFKKYIPFEKVLSKTSLITRPLRMEREDSGKGRGPR